MYDITSTYIMYIKGSVVDMHATTTSVNMYKRIIIVCTYNPCYVHI